MRDHTTRTQKNTTLTLDSESERMLQEIADQDELQPGNRSHTVRRLIRQEYGKDKTMTKYDVWEKRPGVWAAVNTASERGEEIFYGGSPVEALAKVLTFELSPEKWAELQS